MVFSNVLAVFGRARGRMDGLHHGLQKRGRTTTCDSPGRGPHSTSSTSSGKSIVGAVLRPFEGPPRWRHDKKSKEEGEGGGGQDRRKLYNLQTDDGEKAKGKHRKSKHHSWASSVFVLGRFLQIPHIFYTFWHLNFWSFQTIENVWVFCRFGGPSKVTFGCIWSRQNWQYTQEFSLVFVPKKAKSVGYFMESTICPFYPPDDLVFDHYVTPHAPCKSLGIIMEKPRSN